ncbi:kinesin-like protein KIN-7F isoform X1 [Typha latifolia]|uniref:kinesin-like protein KIN-7F isoform X1 n=1 Tax=Typha latifolia TaxID=4733 RepID=UPI003C2CCC9D
MGEVFGDESVGFEGEEGGGGGGGNGGEVEKILVSVRVRPLSEKEIANGDSSDWECINNTTILFKNSAHERSALPTAYTFDRVFRPDCTTKEVYEKGAKDVALSVVSGINSSIFAYGQTSSGKTHTMIGITEYAMMDIFEYVHKHEERAFVLKFSAMEIYNEAVKDLLSSVNAPLRLLDDPEKGTIVEKLTEVMLRDWNHIKEIISFCEAQRKIGETSLNEASSRSHQILRLTVESSAREFLGKENTSTLLASVNFVDLAGSERASSQAFAAGARLKEGCHINRSLLTLGTVIRKLSKERNGHIPYRDSKLTRILQPSLGGNSRTAIICTMSPARSHGEQSRSTLLFATCAKEVVTNAQVNVVMSDKALVKHLQKELARLETELHFPASSSSVEALLREKDAQIRKMEKEKRELLQQRDLAQSQLEDLLQVIGNDHYSRRQASGHVFASFVSCEDEQSIVGSSESSGDQNQNYGFTNSNSLFKHCLQPSESKNQDVVSPEDSIAASSLGEVSLVWSGGGVLQKPHEDREDVCKEVQCVEVNEMRRNRHLDFLSTEGSKSQINLDMNGPPIGDQESILRRQMNLTFHNTTPITLEQHLQNVRKTLKCPVKANHEGSYPWSLKQDLSSFKDFSWSRSRRCRFAPTSSSTWFHDIEQNNCTPPSRCFKEFPGRPDVFQRRRLAFDYDDESETLSTEGSQTSEITTDDALGTQKSKTLCEAAFSGINEFAAELKELVQIQYQNQLNIGQMSTEEFGAEGSMKHIRLDNPILDSLQSPSRSPMEFEKKQLEIIELWHSCNISLVHRTYFFLLFKGDPSDFIYLEVELRRLTFLKNAYAHGDSNRKVAVSGLDSTMVLSMKKLRREREMLCRQMKKRLLAKERESIYTKWGIALTTKRRKQELARLLWTETRDLEHVRESASLVARLTGLLDPGHFLKEMFGLSFTPQKSHRSYNGWQYGISSVK